MTSPLSPGVAEAPKKPAVTSVTRFNENRGFIQGKCWVFPSKKAMKPRKVGFYPSKMGSNAVRSREILGNHSSLDLQKAIHPSIASYQNTVLCSKDRDFATRFIARCNGQLHIRFMLLKSCSLPKSEVFVLVMGISTNSGTPKMDGLQWKILDKWMMTGITTNFRKSPLSSMFRMWGVSGWYGPRLSHPVKRNRRSRWAMFVRVWYMIHIPLRSVRDMKK